jgi:flagellar hook assembly protein FlgD
VNGGLANIIQPASSKVKLVTALLRNAPNPFRASTVLRFQLAAEGPVSLQVFDVAGRLVTTLADGTFPAGIHEVPWTGRDDGGRRVQSGVYFYRLQTPGYAKTYKMVRIN